MTDIVAGTECKFFEWNGSDHDEFRGIVTNVLTGNPQAPNVTLRYSDAAQARQATNVPNIEAFADGDVSGEDYWRPNRVSQGFIPPFDNHVPARGDVVWAFVWDATENDHFEHIAFVRAVQGQPATDSTLNMTIWDETTGDAENVNGVQSFEDFTDKVDAEGSDFWVTRNLGPGDEELA